VSRLPWAIVINPTSGQGKGAEVGKVVVGFFARNDLNYQIITGVSAENVRRDLEKFLKTNPSCSGVICV